ncbi:MAG: cation:proton antiporter [Thermoanaerobaculia bacterium]
MHSELTLVTTLASGLGLALLLGYLAIRVHLPAIVGYLLAGVIIGPATPGFVADVNLAHQLSELGVMLIMFGVGLHFSLADLLAVKKIALPGAIAQIAAATAMGFAAAHYWGWDLGAGLVLGFSLSVASTVVVLRALEDRGSLGSLNGRISVGWLVVEDLVAVFVMVLMPALAGSLRPAAEAGSAAAGSGASTLVWTLAMTLAQVGLFLVVMMVGGRRLFPWILWKVAKTGSRELFTLCVIAAAVGIAYGSSAIFGVSFALGAFFAGMMLGESDLAHRAAEESLPFRDAFSVLFFVAVGMLFDPTILVREPLRVLVVVAIVMIGKPLASLLIVLLLRYPLKTALLVGASRAQIGEFSFILAAMGVGLGILPVEGHDLILAGALVSIPLNHFLFAAIDPVLAWTRKRSPGGAADERPMDPLAALPMTVDEAQLRGHVVLVGYGRVGRRLGEAMAAKGIHFVVAEQSREVVEKLRSQGIHAVKGDASDATVLAQTHVMHARLLVIATPDTFAARKMMEIARILNPKIDTVVRTHSEEEAELLQKEKAGMVFMGEHELASGMSRYILGTLEKEIPAPA